jgi:Acyl-CoA dehydrogenase, C-terminal domain
MRFEVSTELRTFQESVRAAVGDWRSPLEPELGSWLDDRDDALAGRLENVGWARLWAVEQLEVALAGGVQLGRAVVPLCVVDEATLGAPLAVGDRVRHGVDAEACASPQPGFGLALNRLVAERRKESTFDGTGTVRATIEQSDPLDLEESEARLRTWSAATLGYLAGLAEQALEETTSHARRREQFDRSLSSLPAVQARLADAALSVAGLTLTAWAAAAPDGPPIRASSLLWAGRACRDVTATAQQLHGATGFALETGLHRYFRRAKSIEIWNAAVCRVVAGDSA